MGGRSALVAAGALAALFGYTLAFWGYGRTRHQPIGLLDLLLPTRLGTASAWWGQVAPANPTANSLTTPGTPANKAANGAISAGGYVGAVPPSQVPASK